MRRPLDIATSTYGSDQSGFVWGYLFSPGAAGQPIEATEALEWLQRPEAERAQEFIWLHFNLSNAGTEAWLKQNLELTPFFFEALQDGSRSTRVEFVDDTLIAVVNDVLYDFSFDASQISTIWLNVNQYMFVSARVKPLRSIDQLRAATKAGEPFSSTVELLVHLLHDQADVLVRIVRDTVARVDQIEDEMLTGRHQNKRVHLGQLRRVLVRLKRLLAPEPAALFRLLNRPPEWMKEEDVEELRQSTEEFSVSLNDAGTLEERIKLLQEEIAAQVQEQNNDSLFVLTILTVLALPVNITAGLFGMNVGGIPLAEDSHGFWIVVFMVATFTLAIGYWVFQRRNSG